MKDGRRKQEWFKGFDVTELFGCHGTNDRALIGVVPRRVCFIDKLENM